MFEKISVGVLGATGAVGQRFIQLLENHPWFEIVTLGASAKSAGRHYEEAASWKLSSPMPENIKKKVVASCLAENFSNCRIVFSGLDSSVAGTIEEDFARSGIAVFSNAKNHRYDDDVPILIPFSNPNHIDIIPYQQEKRGWKNGFIVTNANCSTTGLAIAISPLQEKYGISKIIAFTMQAISGAGYPGLPAIDVFDNVIPFIGGEEEKLVKETKKILAPLQDNKFVDADIQVAAHCNRVHVLDGHTECLSIKLNNQASIQEIEDYLTSYEHEVQSYQLPSTPQKPLILLKEENRPQPRLDRLLDQGYTTTVGRLRKCEIFDIKLVLLSHNTVIGAAGGSILNAELAFVKKLL